MSTDDIQNLSIEYVQNVVDSQYEFNRFDKDGLKGEVAVIKLQFTTHSSWQPATDNIFDYLVKRYKQKNCDIYGFIANPAWKSNTRISRHYGLNGALTKDFGVESLEFLSEQSLTKDNDIIFYGVIKLNEKNARNVFELLSAYENGIVFSSAEADSPEFNVLIEDLAKLVSKKMKNSTFNLNIIEAINAILSKGFDAIFPYAWQETGEYHLDIFQKTNTINRADKYL